MAARRSGRTLKIKQDKKIKNLTPNKNKKEQSLELPTIQFPGQMTQNNEDNDKLNITTDNLQRNEQDEWNEWMRPCLDDNRKNNSVNTIVNNVVEALKVEQKHFTRAKVRVHFNSSML